MFPKTCCLFVNYTKTLSVVQRIKSTVNLFTLLLCVNQVCFLKEALYKVRGDKVREIHFETPKIHFVNFLLQFSKSTRFHRQGSLIVHFYIFACEYKREDMN
jgi:hypothetical protein